MAAEVHVGPDGDEYTKEIYEIPSIVQGAKVVRIESNAFKGNTHLKSITFPAENLTSIPGNGFAECTALERLRMFWWLYGADRTEDRSFCEVHLWKYLRWLHEPDQTDL